MSHDSITQPLASLLGALGIEAKHPRVLANLDASPAPVESPSVDLLVLGPEGLGPRPDGEHPARFAAWSSGLAQKGALLIRFDGPRDDASLAAWRDAAWPRLHVTAVLRPMDGGVRCERMSGVEKHRGEFDLRGDALLLHLSSDVLAPDATVQKFDANAEGWNGNPASPGYPHHRWMRRLVAEYAQARPEGGVGRILDFGCGAGWVGIEAALRTPGAHLAFFDPSPAMVRHAEDNARAAGLTDFEGRTGFGEAPPFPEGDEPPFDRVISSGVVSFSPDRQAWFDGLQRSCAPGASVVVGDISRDSAGFARRRKRKPMLPIRELNAMTRDEAIDALARRGFRVLRSSGYQLTWPIPQAMHLSETKLKGLLSRPLLWMNQAGAALDRGMRSPARSLFDSWMVEAIAPS